MLSLWFIHYDHVHTQRDDTYIPTLLLKSFSIMHIIPHLKHLTSLHRKQKKQGREQKVTNEEEEGVGRQCVAGRDQTWENRDMSNS